MHRSVEGRVRFPPIADTSSRAVSAHCSPESGRYGLHHAMHLVPSPGASANGVGAGAVVTIDVDGAPDVLFVVDSRQAIAIEPRRPCPSGRGFDTKYPGLPPSISRRNRLRRGLRFEIARLVRVHAPYGPNALHGGVVRSRTHGAPVM